MRENHKRHQHHCHRRHRRSRAGHHGIGREPWAQGPSFQRRFATREERIARLGAYLGELRAEAEAVEQRIAELKAISNS